MPLTVRGQQTDATQMALPRASHRGVWHPTTGPGECAAGRGPTCFSPLTQASLSPPSTENPGAPTNLFLQVKPWMSSPRENPFVQTRFAVLLPLPKRTLRGRGRQFDFITPDTWALHSETRAAARPKRQCHRHSLQESRSPKPHKKIKT